MNSANGRGQDMNAARLMTGQQVTQGVVQPQAQPATKQSSKTNTNSQHGNQSAQGN